MSQNDRRVDLLLQNHVPLDASEKYDPESPPEARVPCTPCMHGSTQCLLVHDSGKGSATVSDCLQCRRLNRECDVVHRNTAGQPREYYRYAALGADTFAGSVARGQASPLSTANTIDLFQGRKRLVLASTLVLLSRVFSAL